MACLGRAAFAEECVDIEQLCRSSVAGAMRQERCFRVRWMHSVVINFLSVAFGSFVLQWFRLAIGMRRGESFAQACVSVVHCKLSEFGVS